MTTTMILFTSICLFSTPVSEPITIDQVLEIGMANQDVLTILRSNEAIAQHHISAVKKWENPAIMTSWEKVDGELLDTSESYLILSQKIELSGEKRLETRAAQHFASAEILASKSQLIDRAHKIKHDYYELMTLQERRVVLELWVNNLGKINKIIALREQAGDTSGLDLMRNKLELSQTKSELDAIDIEISKKWQLFSSFVGMDGDVVPKLSGNLLPELSPTGDFEKKNPEIMRLDENIKAYEQLAQSAKRWAIPNPTIAAGMKQSDDGLRNDSGFFLSASFSIPLFNRRKSDLGMARSQAAMARSEKNLLKIERQSRLVSASQELAQSVTSAKSLRQEMLRDADDMVKTAQLAYEAGEISLYILLDTFESYFQAQTEVINRENRARNAALEWERLMGVIHD